MKKTLYALFTVLVLVACKKGKDAIQPTVIGYWEGNYGNGNEVPATPYIFLFRSNGTVRVYANNTDTATANIADGTYFVTGATVKATYTYPPSESYSVAATLDAGITAMDGTWGAGTNTTNGGSFRIFKK
ncbi:hypothetical protein A8C56_22400 [Niabella ginsenosidivorans]|uniref:Uncharacterized protein n=1 Tax=Niabella ginsenosidivorans TaxID=1176587 RepID=A0A1A9I8H2_9BACT|nr:hypothetical protein [Niabella ginsenosidivorans]ANH83369.1 hypothetical protein A8C56_22400 [Niabella ginsenosidivorans]